MQRTPYISRALQRTSTARLMGALLLAALAACDSPNDPEVPPPAVASVQLSETEVLLPIGAEQQLSAITKAADGRTLGGRQITWASSDTTVAKVSTTGRVTGIADGVTKITATSEGKKAEAQFTVRATSPVPTISALAPASVTVGGPNFTLTVTGTGFTPGARVRLNGTPLAVTYVSATELRAEVTSAHIASVADLVLTVVNLPPGGGVSNALTFTVAPPPEQNPVPQIASLSPSWAIAGGQGITLTVRGSDFAATSTVLWNGVPRPTTRINTGELRALILAEDLASAGTAQVSVVNPAPGGGTALVNGYVVAPVTPPTPEALRAAYREDAARLAARIRGADAEVELPAALVTSLYEALVRVSEFNHPARDSIVDIYQVHSWGNPPLREILVGVDPAAAWVAQWRAGSRLTGNSQVDALMEQHRLELVRYHDWGSGHTVLLRPAEPLNIAALAARFRAIPGVTLAGGNVQAGGGNDLQATALGSVWRLEYSLGWGDCLSGCGNQHIWSFDVRPDGSVLYRGSTGLPAPPPNRMW